MSGFGREHQRAPTAELLKEILEDLFILSLHWRSLGTTTPSTLNMEPLGLNATHADQPGATKPRPPGGEAPPAGKRGKHRTAAGQAAPQLPWVSRNLLEGANDGARENPGGSPACSIEAALESLVYGAIEGGPPWRHRPCSPHSVTG